MRWKRWLRIVDEGDAWRLDFEIPPWVAGLVIGFALTGVVVWVAAVARLVVAAAS